MSGRSGAARSRVGLNVGVSMSPAEATPPLLRTRVADLLAETIPSVQALANRPEFA
jgi:hypothetical protein